MPDQRRGGAQALVVTGLLGQVREQGPQVSPGVPQPPGLGGVPQYRLHDRQGDQLSVAQLRADADLRAVLATSLFGDVAAALREHGSATLDERCYYVRRPD